MKTAQSIIKKNTVFHTVKNLKGHGSKPKMTTVATRLIVQELRKTLRIITKTIVMNLSSSGTNVSIKHSNRGCTWLVFIDNVQRGRHTEPHLGKEESF